MLEKEQAKIKKLNSQRIQLKGYYFPSENNKKTCVFAISGFGGAFNSYFINIANACQEANISFLFGNTQGNYIEKELKKFNEDGSYKMVLRGSCYEDYNNILPDLDCWLNFLKKLGYEDFF